jgi:uncharacterized protein YbjT (DUF2867 family)
VGRLTLVVGATGLLGGEICRQLRAKGAAVRGLVRVGSPREPGLAGLGVEIAYGDLKDRPSLAPACAGATAVVSTANSVMSRRPGDSLRSVDRNGHMALIETARAAGVARFIYTSVSPGASARAPLVRIKREVERAVRRSGMTWTVLQPCSFMDIGFSAVAGWDLAGGKATIVGSGSAPVSYISAADVARFAVLALERAEFANRDLPLGGPEAVSPLEAVRAFEAAAGRGFGVRRIPVAVLRIMGSILRPFVPIPSSLMTMVAEAAKRGDVIEMGPLLESLTTPMRLTTVREFAKRELAGDPANASD